MIHGHHKLTSRLVGSLGNEDRVLVLRPSVDMVDVVGAVVGVVDPLPAEGELTLVAVLWPLLLHPGESGVQPVRGACGWEDVRREDMRRLREDNGVKEEVEEEGGVSCKDGPPGPNVSLGCRAVAMAKMAK